MVKATPTWVIRGGDDNRHVDQFLDGGYTAVAFPEVGDGRRIERFRVIRLLEDGGQHKDANAAALRFQSFVTGISVGDGVLMPDGARKEIVIGIVEGDYEFHEEVSPANFRHRRPVRWVGRHSRDDLPAAWFELHKQRPVINRYDALSLADHIARVEAGEVGRPATQRSGRAASSPSSRASAPRAPRASRAAPKPPPRKLRTCPGCGFNLADSMFEGGDGLCRDCR